MIKTQYDAKTNTTIEVEFDKDDFAQLKADQAVEAERLDEIAARATAKAALLTRLGITADEAALLLG